MERKIGEIFKYNGEWYQCLKSKGACSGCIAFGKNYSFCRSFGECTGDTIFKKLEKVGEPITVKSRTFQKLTSDNNSCKECVFNVPNKACCKNSYIEGICDDNGFWVEIKQNKEDMEGKTNLYEKQTPLQKLMEIYCDGRMDYNEFEKKVKELYSDKGDDSKPILKPFDLETAKQGKSVCTRDGRKARIICFDYKSSDDYSIIALIDTGDNEIPYKYTKEGKFKPNCTDAYDLMMLPEKKEGWVNIVRGSDGKSHMGRGIFQSKEVAEDAIKAFSDNLIDTVKIFWEE